MPRTSETELYKWLEEAFRTTANNVFKIRPYELDWCRIESHINAGVPDINACIRGIEFWIEAKVDEFELGPLQQSWITRGRLCGRHVFAIRYNSPFDNYTVSFSEKVESTYKNVNQAAEAIMLYLGHRLPAPLGAEV